MAIPMLGAVAAVGKSVVAGSVKGLVMAGKATAKIGKGVGKKSTNILKISKKIKGNINIFQKKDKKFRLNRKRIQHNILQRRKSSEKEKELEVKKNRTFRNTIKSVIALPMTIGDKLLGLGGIFLTGIIVNALDGIIEQWRKFKTANAGVFEAVGNVVKMITDAFGNIFESFTGPFAEEGSLDWLAKFNDDGTLQSGQLKNLQDEIAKLKPLVDSINEALGVDGHIIDDEGRIDPLTDAGKAGELDEKTGKPERFSDTFDLPYNEKTGETLTFDELQGESGLIKNSDGVWVEKSTGRKPPWWKFNWINEMLFEHQLPSESSITPVEPSNTVIDGDQSSSATGRTIIIARQPILQPFPVTQVVPSGTRSKSNVAPASLSSLWSA